MTSSIEQSPHSLGSSSPSRYRTLLYGVYRSGHYGISNPDTEAARANRRESYMRELGALLPAKHSARILDAGCGSGFLLEFLRERGYANACGVDSSQEQVAFCRGKELSVEQGDIIEFLESGARWEQILCTDVIEHLHKDEVVRFLEASYAALLPGGTLVVRTGNAASIYGLYLRYIDFTHETFYTEKSLSQLFVACGFRNVRLFDSKAPFDLRPKRLARWLLLKVWRAGLRIAFVLEVGTDAPRLMGKFLTATAIKPESDAAIGSKESRQTSGNP